MNLLTVIFLALVASQNANADVSHLLNKQYLPPQQQGLSGSDAAAGVFLNQETAPQQQPGKYFHINGYEIAKSIPISSYSTTSTYPLYSTTKARSQNALEGSYDYPLPKIGFQPTQTIKQSAEQSSEQQNIRLNGVGPVILAADFSFPANAQLPNYQQTHFKAAPTYPSTHFQPQSAVNSYNYPQPQNALQVTQDENAQQLALEPTAKPNIDSKAVGSATIANVRQSIYEQQTYANQQANSMPPAELEIPGVQLTNPEPAAAPFASNQQSYSTPDQSFPAALSHSVQAQQAELSAAEPSNEYLPPPTDAQQLTPATPVPDAQSYSTTPAAAQTQDNNLTPREESASNLVSVQPSFPEYRPTFQQQSPYNITTVDTNAAQNTQQYYASNPQTSNFYLPPVPQTQTPSGVTQEQENNQSNSVAASQSRQVSQLLPQQYAHEVPQSNQLSRSNNFADPTPTEATYMEHAPAQEAYSVSIQSQDLYSVPSQSVNSPTAAAANLQTTREYLPPVAVGLPANASTNPASVVTPQEPSPNNPQPHHNPAPATGPQPVVASFQEFRCSSVPFNPKYLAPVSTAQSFPPVQVVVQQDPISVGSEGQLSPAYLPPRPANQKSYQAPVFTPIFSDSPAVAPSAITASSPSQPQNEQSTGSVPVTDLAPPLDKLPDAAQRLPFSQLPSFLPTQSVRQYLPPSYSTRPTEVAPALIHQAYLPPALVPQSQSSSSATVPSSQFHNSDPSTLSQTDFKSSTDPPQPRNSPQGQQPSHYENPANFALPQNQPQPATSQVNPHTSLGTIYGNNGGYVY